MSEEEWLVFCANPLPATLTLQLLQQKSDDITDLMFSGNIPIHKTVEIAGRLRELGFVVTHEFAMSACLEIGSDYCLKILDAVGYEPSSAVLHELNVWFDYDDDGDEERLMIRLIDRCPTPFRNAPMFAIYFLRSRKMARYGAVAVMGAARRREAAVGVGWKDISHIIGRVVWSTRRFYKKDE